MLLVDCKIIRNTSGKQECGIMLKEASKCYGKIRLLRNTGHIEKQKAMMTQYVCSKVADGCQFRLFSTREKYITRKFSKADKPAR